MQDRTRLARSEIESLAFDVLVRARQHIDAVTVLVIAAVAAPGAIDNQLGYRHAGVYGVRYVAENPVAADLIQRTRPLQVAKDLIVWADQNDLDALLPQPTRKLRPDGVAPAGVDVAGRCEVQN